MVSTYYRVVIKAIISAIKAKGESVYRRIAGYPVIYNANRVSDAKYPKRALLIYIVKPFLVPETDSSFLQHQNMRQCRQIAEIIGQFGYIVDVVEIGDRRFVPCHEYTLIICHAVNLHGKEKLFSDDAIKVYLSTGTSHTYHNAGLRRRVKSFEARRRCRLSTLRWCDENTPFLQVADAIVGFGNEYIMSTWRQSHDLPTFGFNNYGFPGTEFVSHKESDAARHFLFMGGGPAAIEGA